MNREKLKIIFVGMPDMALVCLSNLIAKDFNIVGVVPPKKTHETYNYFKQFVLSKNLNFIDFENSPNDEKCIGKIKELNADIGIVCSYNYKLSKEFLSTTKMGYINSHPSLLPDYRGAAPYFHIINNGEKQSGITLHFMDENFDTGDIIYQEKLKLSPFETMGTLFNRTNFMISDALIKVLSNIQNGNTPLRTPQNKTEMYIEAPKVDGYFRIRWNKNVHELEQLVRACNPFYSAFTTFRGVNLKVLRASVFEKKHDLKYGQIALVSDKNFLVAGNGGYLALEVFQLSTWGVFNPNDFYYTFNPKVGEILE